MGSLELPPIWLIPSPNHSLAEILIPPQQDTREKLGDNFDLYPPKIQSGQNSYTPGVQYKDERSDH